MTVKAHPPKRAGENTPYTWFVNCGMPAFATLAGIPLDRLFLDVDAIVEAFRKGKPLAEDLFGPDVNYGPPRCPAISYGHVNTLGSRLVFPENSEVAHTPVYASLQEGIGALKTAVDFATAGMFPFYLQMWERLKKIFPDEKITFVTFSAEGPVGTAWALRGHDFFMDTLDHPHLLAQYMRLVTESVLRYRKLLASLNRESRPPSQEVVLSDDIASLISPSRWPEVVIPYHEFFFDKQMARVRRAHIEGLTTGHLRFLDELRLDLYDPSMSPKLTPALVRDHCSVPFWWRLNTSDYARLSCEDIEEWVFGAVADGASVVRTVVDRALCTEDTVDKVRAFIRAAKKVEKLLAAGHSRDALRRHRGLDDQECAREV